MSPLKCIQTTVFFTVISNRLYGLDSGDVNKDLSAKDQDQDKDKD